MATPDRYRYTAAELEAAASATVVPLSHESIGRMRAAVYRRLRAELHVLELAGFTMRELVLVTVAGEPTSGDLAPKTPGEIGQPAHPAQLKVMRAARELADLDEVTSADRVRLDGAVRAWRALFGTRCPPKPARVLVTASGATILLHGDGLATMRGPRAPIGRFDPELRTRPCSHGTEGAWGDPSTCSACVAQRAGVYMHRSAGYQAPGPGPESEEIARLKVEIATGHRVDLGLELSGWTDADLVAYYDSDLAPVGAEARRRGTLNPGKGKTEEIASEKSPSTGSEP